MSCVFWRWCTHVHHLFHDGDERLRGFFFGTELLTCKWHHPAFILTALFSCILKHSKMHQANCAVMTVTPLDVSVINLSKPLTSLTSLTLTLNRCCTLWTLQWLRLWAPLLQPSTCHRRPPPWALQRPPLTAPFLQPSTWHRRYVNQPIRGQQLLAVTYNI